MTARKTIHGMTSARALCFIFLFIGAWLTTTAAGPVGGPSESPPFEELGDLQGLLQELRTYEQGTNDDIVVRFNAWMRENRTDPGRRTAIESDLTGFLESEATAAGKMEVCRQLRIIGTSLSVPALERLLLDESTFDLARYALEKIPGPEASQALLRALGSTRGAFKIGIIDSLANRDAPEAVPALKTSLREGGAVQEAAASALARLGGEEAVESLTAALDGADPVSRPHLAAALLDGAVRTFGSDNRDRLADVCTLLMEETYPIPVRQASFRERVRIDPESGRELILGTLEAGNDALFLDAVIDLIPLCFDIAGIGPVCTSLPALSPEHRVQLLNILRQYPSQEVLGAVKSALDDGEPAVRAAALTTLGGIGDGTLIPLLVEKAVSGSGIEREAARGSLGRLRGEDIDGLLLEAMSRSRESSVQAEYIRAVGERRIRDSAGSLFELAGSGEPEVRLQAVRALRDLAPPKELDRLVDRLFTAEGEREKLEWTLAVTAAVKRLDQATRLGSAITRLIKPDMDPGHKADLFRVLGKIGDDNSLPVLRDGVEDPDPMIRDAVIRALAEWPGHTPKDDLLDIAARTENLTHHVLALQGYIRMVGQDRLRLPKAAVNSLRKALDLARRPEEKRAALGMLSRFPCAEALLTAESMLWKEGVEEEAEAAVDRIRQSLQNTWKRKGDGN